MNESCLKENTLLELRHFIELRGSFEVSCKIFYKRRKQRLERLSNFVIVEVQRFNLNPLFCSYILMACSFLLGTMVI